MVTSEIIFDKSSSFDWVGDIDIEQYSIVYILVDENTGQHCLPLLRPTLERLQVQYLIFSIQSGEKYKNLDTCKVMWEDMTKHHLKRNAMFLNLGGGVIGDMGGFCASAYKRGVDFINVPTTLLAQVDASVGGKLGVDFQGFKNHIGFFKEPKYVIINTKFLQSLPDEQLLSGFAEVIKHCLIRDRAAFYNLINEDYPNLDFMCWIEHSIDVKSKIVTEDPLEKGLRKLLNFGHTIGHAVETWYLNKNIPLLHGEAVALGMVCETFLSVEKLNLDIKEAQDIYKYILSLYPKQNLDPNSFKEIAKLALQDKKNIKDIEAVLLNNIGNAAFGIPITIDEIIATLEFYNDLQSY